MIHSTVRTFAWWVWLLGQAAAVALYVAGIGLSGGYPNPVEATAPIGLTVGQLILGVLLAPVLLNDRPTIFNAIWVAVLCHAVAGRVAGVSVVAIVPLLATVSVWLGIAALSARWPVARLGLCFATFAGPVLFYSRLEYGRAPTSPHDWAWAWSPTVGIYSTGSHFGVPPTFFVGSGLLAVVLMVRWAENRLTSAAAGGV